MGSSRVGSNPTRSVLRQQSERVPFLLSVLPANAHYLSRNSSVGRASDWRSEGPWFNPGFRHYACQNKPQHFVLLSNCRVCPDWLQVAARQHDHFHHLLTTEAEFGHDFDTQYFCINKHQGISKSIYILANINDADVCSFLTFYKNTCCSRLHIFSFQDMYAPPNRIKNESESRRFIYL